MYQLVVTEQGQIVFSHTFNHLEYAKQFVGNETGQTDVHALTNYTLWTKDGRELIFRIYVNA